MVKYPFPENKNRRQQWINTFNIVSVTTQEADDLKVCSQHYLLIKVNYLKQLYLISRLSNIFRLITHEKVVSTEDYSMLATTGISGNTFRI